MSAVGRKEAGSSSIIPRRTGFLLDSGMLKYSGVSFKFCAVYIWSLQPQTRVAYFPMHPWPSAILNLRRGTIEGMSFTICDSCQATLKALTRRAYFIGNFQN